MIDRSCTAKFDWEDVRYFLALARAGSLSAAARNLRVNHATVGRRIGTLEAALGYVLFDRRANGYGLTAHGQELLETALAMERAALALPESLDAPGFQGVVRLSTVRSLADAFLVDRLGALRHQYPGIVIEIVTDVRVVSLARREADVALRLGRPSDSGLVGRRLAEVHYAFYAAPTVAVALDSDTPLIGYDPDSVSVVEAGWMERQFAGRLFAFRSNSNAAQAAAARAGFGVAMLPRYMGDRDSSLTEVDLGPAHPPRELWLLSPRELGRQPRVRAVLNAVTDAVTGSRDLLEGKRGTIGGMQTPPEEIKV